MNHTQLKAFDAVVREGSFSRAGIRLGLTQPAITIQVKALERYYGKKLFNRRGRGVTPTTTGQSLYEITQRLFKIEEQAHYLLKNQTDEKSAGNLKVGSDCQGLAVGLVTEWARQHQGVFVTFHHYSADMVYRELLSGNLDVVITATPTKDNRFVVKTLGDQHLMLLVPKHHPLSNRKTISLEELTGVNNLIYDNGSIIQHIFNQATQGQDKTMQPTMNIGSSDAIRHAVGDGFGVGVVIDSEAASDGRFVALEVIGVSEHLLSHVVVLKTMEDQPILKSFVSEVAPLVKRQQPVFFPIGMGDVPKPREDLGVPLANSANLFQRHLKSVAGAGKQTLSGSKR